MPAAPPTPARTPSFRQLREADPDAERRELLAGLTQPAAAVAPKFLYDRLGSRLFEAITELPEYYPTRAEREIFDARAAEIAEAVGGVGTLVDLGSGNCEKALHLMPALRPQRYVAVDISVDFLREALDSVQRRHPALEVLGLGLDFSERLELPGDALVGRPVFFYPGSSIGNFAPEDALDFLRGLQAAGGPAGGGLLIGVDLVKPAAVLEPAYDDALGVTAAFNLNLLRHVNARLGSDFDPRDWRHVACYDAAAARIEMHLEARQAVQVRWPGGERRFAAGERIHTEYSHKTTVPGFGALLADAGFRRVRHWTDDGGRFAVFWAGA
jgi:dimethylhistidine N-methyltransferase